ncbi:MAG: hypothetical protein GY870_07060, partial [archaeon]|nr:hypothetical protein [archaeon]
FHDILPGSSVAEVYPLTWKEHDFVINKMKSLLNDTVTEIYERLPDNEEKILIYNPVSVMNEAIIPIGDSELILNNLKSLSFTVIDKNELIKASESEEDLKVTENDSVLIIENDSLRVLISKDDGNLKGLQMNGGKSGKKPSENIGNMLYGERNGYTDYPIPTNVEIDNLNPKILKMRGARLRVYHENFEGAEYPAWDLDKEYKLKEESIIPLEKITIQNDRNMISVNVSYKFLNSTAEVKYILRSRSDKLDIKLDIDLKDPKVLIKYFIPLNIKSDDVVAETPFGSISRKRIPKTNMEKAKWEFSMHKWLDIADEDVGITILNEDRYGASADAKGAGITLVRSPPYPVSPFHTCQQIFEEGEKPEFTDIMKHNFNLAILPHVGSWKEHNIPARALAFNNKSIVIQKSKKSDSKTKLTENDLFTIPAEKSEQSIDIKILKTPRIETNAENVILSVLKPGEWMDIDHAHEMELIKSEKGYIGENYYLPEEPSVWTWDKRTIILRVYESIGQKTSTEINILYAIEANRIETIEEIDMLEWKKYADVDFKAIDNIKNSILIETELNPYEIKTFKISLKK